MMGPYLLTTTGKKSSDRSLRWYDPCGSSANIKPNKN